MADPYIYDAINAFKYSPTGRGQFPMTEPTEYVQRYRQLVSSAIPKLWHLYNKDEIGFEKMDSLGQAMPKWAPLWTPGYHILVNKSERTQAKLGAASSTLVHEAVHLVTSRPYVEEEMRCRTVEVFYYSDLLRGVTITSKQTNKNITVRVPPGNNMGDLMVMHAWYKKSQLLDFVLNMKEYRKSLDAKWIKHSYKWWKGLGNRWPKTKGYYLNALAKEGQIADYSLIITLLESVSRSEWATVKAAMISEGGSLAELQRALRLGLMSHNIWYRVNAVQKKLGDSFLAKSA